MRERQPLLRRLHRPERKFERINRREPIARAKEQNLMLALIGIVLIVFWLLGFTLHIAGGLIHILLVVAVVVFILHFLRGA